MRSVPHIAGTALLLSAAVLVAHSCTKETDLRLPEYTPVIVVEGYIETDLPPVVFISRAMPFFGTIDVSTYMNSFVHGATVAVIHGGSTHQLQEVCVDTLSPALRQVLAQMLPLQDRQGELPPICFYTVRFTPTPQLTGKEGGTYTLTIQIGDTLITATTSIPYRLNFDSLWTDSPGAPRQALIVRYRDPDTAGNYFLVYTRRQGEPFCRVFGALFDDRYANGKTLAIPMPRGYCNVYDESVYQDENFNKFYRGDTVGVRLAAVDYRTYRFWLTLENVSATLISPFGGSTLLETNLKSPTAPITGIWAGLATTYYTLVVE